MSTQLFRTRAIEVPDFVIVGNGPRIRYETIQSFPFMYWPDGKPCEPVNMYFLNIAKYATGDSLKTYASDLSHLVRYCYKHTKSIGNLTDDDIFKWRDNLKSEKASHNPIECARNQNTIRVIMSSAIRFLLWYQECFVLPTATPLIGELELAPQIVVTLKRNSYSKSTRREFYYIHRAMPTPISREPKRPIGQGTIESIQKIIDSKACLEKQTPRTLQRYSKNLEVLDAQLSYVRSRRHFMIWIMRRVGLRPSEMIGISHENHVDVMKKRCILIPTKKRRRVIAPLRSFPITLADSMVFYRYLIARNKYLDFLRTIGKAPGYSDALLLSIDGSPIKKTSVETDFKRLTFEAGFSDSQACFSMFRHRFITIEVIVHLKEFMDKSGKNRHLLTDSDYQSILTRVSKKTGHGDPKSLWHYIDIAWDEMNVWGNIDNKLQEIYAVDRFSDELRNLLFELEAKPETAGTKEIVSDLASRLTQILDMTKAEIKHSDI